ncbi:flagellar motor protein MotB [Pueribacillus theae]|uniref:Flagellar motor protein MotB n=1 Tax=Pueribacillus theae TaxID=2171751 RepID=A0A2U1JK50_9BACI|nr:OmpA family protein [Pueribacillus theae]PWA05517.1 flagellar motor protein MotB [Pueribacillus theae]
MSYSDLMSALLLLFALFLMISLMVNQESIEKKDQMIEEVIGVKTRIIQELIEAFKGSNHELEVDPQTGAISFSGGVFFDSNSSSVSESGRNELEEFIPVYIGILLSDQFRDEISQIIIEGHTDTVGGYLFNLRLSQNRALAVAEEIFSKDFPNFAEREYLKQVITANGRSYSIPLLDNKGQIDLAKSRRVEFKFRLKDDEVIEEIQKMVKQNEH